MCLYAFKIRLIQHQSQEREALAPQTILSLVDSKTGLTMFKRVSFIHPVTNQIICIEKQAIIKQEMKKEVKELTLHPVINSKTSLTVKPFVPNREKVASKKH